jgi:hypothetical protein
LSFCVFAPRSAAQKLSYIIMPDLIIVSSLPDGDY